MMSESQAPSQPPPATHTTVTVESKPTSGGQGGLNIRFNPSYFKTVPGILKIVQLVLGIVCMALASPARHSATGWFLFVATTAFILTLFWVFFYLLSLRELLYKLPVNWLTTELLNTGIDFILYFIAFIVQLATWGQINRDHFFYHWTTVWDCNIAAGAFGIFNTMAYGFGAFLLYRDWKGTTTSSQ